MSPNGGFFPFFPMVTSAASGITVITSSQHLSIRDFDLNLRHTPVA